MAVRRTAASLALGCALLAACSADPGDDAGTSPAEEPAATQPTTDGATATAPDEDGADTTATDEPAETSDAPDDDPTSDEPAAAPPDGLDVEVVAEGLTIPWDVQLLPDGTALVTERGGRLLALDGGAAAPREVAADLSELFVGSEAGLMGLAISPDVEQDRSIYLCHAAQPADGPPDVRVTRWTIDEGVTTASQEGVVVDGIPLTSGRHSGCRLLALPDGTLAVGTGDAADETTPQAVDSLGGKVLHVTVEGDPATPDGAVPGGDPRILTYGHRNVQGLALQPGTDTLWSVEHGPSVDDEVNVLVPGGNYGWDPGPGYDEGVPMTDLDAYPDAVEAAWSSGSPTRATSGATFLEGEAWGAWEGWLAVAELKGSGLTLLQVEGEEVTGTARPPELDGTYGRLRSLTLGDDGALWVTTSNGNADDVVLRVTPRG